MVQQFSIELLAGNWRVRDNATGKLLTQPFKVFAHAQRLADDLCQSRKVVAEIESSEAFERERRSRELEAVRLKAIERLAKREFSWARAVNEMQREAV